MTPPAGQSMAEGPRRLDQLATVMLDGNGAAGAAIGPVPAHRQWRIGHISLSGNSTAKPAAKVFRNGPSGSYIGGSSNANLDGNELPDPLGLFPGESLFVVWSGGTPGAVMTATVEGMAL